jgi:hypothetical protein
MMASRKQRLMGKPKRRRNLYGVDESTARQCLGKTRYETKPKAQLAKARAAVVTGDLLHEYRCEVCRTWHLGHAAA